MRAVLQRVAEARVEVAGETVGEIGQGYLLLVGVGHDDGPAEAAALAAKVANLRLFADAAGAMNRSALDLLAAGEPVGMLVVSQFTLYADARKGRRPSFTDAAPPAVAAPLAAAFANTLRGFGLPVAEGRFGAAMRVSLTNDGPVTLWLDSTELRHR